LYEEISSQGTQSQHPSLGPMLAMQTDEQRRNIESAIIEGASKYATDSGVEIPTSVMLAVGYKP
jgi:hypothetical protein